MIDNHLIKKLRDCARKGKTLAETSAQLQWHEMEVLKECWELAGFRNELPIENLTSTQREEFFNRCRPKIGRLFIKPEIDTTNIDNGPIFSQPQTKKPIHLSHRMPDPYLRPELRKVEPPSGYNKQLLERERILQYRQAHPKVVFKKQSYCYQECQIGRALRYNVRCKHSAGIYTYAGENYIACLYFESDLSDLPL